MNNTRNFKPVLVAVPSTLALLGLGLVGLVATTQSRVSDTLTAGQSRRRRDKLF